VLKPSACQHHRPTIFANDNRDWCHCRVSITLRVWGVDGWRRTPTRHRQRDQNGRRYLISGGWSIPIRSQMRILPILYLPLATNRKHARYSGTYVGKWEPPSVYLQWSGGMDLNKLRLHLITCNSSSQGLHQHWQNLTCLSLRCTHPVKVHQVLFQNDPLKEQSTTGLNLHWLYRSLLCYLTNQIWWNHIPEQKKMMIVAIAVPVSIAACSKSTQIKFSGSSSRTQLVSYSHSVSTGQMHACASISSIQSQRWTKENIGLFRWL
jgi:hypothetical protein